MGAIVARQDNFHKTSLMGRLRHFVLLNAQKLCDTQHMMQQILLSLVHALYEGNPQPVFANTEKLNDAVEELRQLLDNHHDLKVVETPIYGYVWLNMETAHQLAGPCANNS
ncbi:inner membrane protein YeeA [Shigella flexneri]|nr:inner membrane protein YeeA [Shigella flexneri]